MPETENLNLSVVEEPATVAPAEEQQSACVLLRNVDIAQKRAPILLKVSFQILPGEFVYLIGKTGTGKSSIMKLLFADIPAKGEKAMCAGYDLLAIRQRDIPYLRRKLGIVFQDYRLLAGKTVSENLLSAMRATGWKDKSAMENRAHEVLKLVHLETKGFKYPHQLSGGEQQRVCVARALLNKPELILADEPTGNLDPITAEEIFQLFHDINAQGTTVLMSTHNFSMINKFASRTICIEDGQLIDSQV